MAEPFRPVDLGEIVDEVLSDLEVRLVKTSDRVETSGFPLIEAAPIQMRQLFQKFLSGMDSSSTKSARNHSSKFFVSRYS